MRPIDRPVRAAGSALAAYEALAIATGRVPTLSQLCRRARRHPAGRAAVAAICVWLAVHLAADP